MIVPNFAFRPNLVADDLRRLQDPCVIFEYIHVDSDGEPAYIYTVGGWLDGKRIPDGATVGNETILVHAKTRDEADYLAGLGLQDTISALVAEEKLYQEANASLARLSSVGAIERANQATKPDSDKSDAFVEDVKAIRPLIGDDVILTTQVH